MADVTLEQRVAWLQNGLREIGKMCLQLGDSGTLAQPPQTDVSVKAPSESAKHESDNSASDTGPATAAVIPLSQFLGGVQDLLPSERLAVAEAAIAMLSQVYAHLPLKRTMHGIDPIQRLRLLRQRLIAQSGNAGQQQSARAFHDEMIEIFHSLRDLHTNYILPISYQGRTAFLPFLVQEFFDGDPLQRHYVVTRVQAGFTDPTFKPGVTVTHWNGIPIDRAVELNAAREAGSNADARHARGLEALTLRSMALTAPPDESWVIIGYDADGQHFERRFEWQVTAPPPPANGASVYDSVSAAGESVRLMGFDAKALALHRAKKLLFFPEAIATEHRMAQLMVATEKRPALGAGDPGGAVGATDSIMRGANADQEALRRVRNTVRYTNVASAQRALQDVAASAAMQVPVAAAAAEGPTTTSLLPDFFSFRTVTTPSGVFGYIRIFSFMALDANAFVAEFARIAKLLPQNGLIIDVRGNGGGNINAGEQLLQLLTSKPIETERFHFINSPTTLQLCSAEPSLLQWVPSINLALETGEIYSQGFPLTADQQANSSINYRYPGKVVLLIDPLCYSTTDIFTAGFQDHGIGKIIGTSGHTGAGGANVWTYDFFADLPGFGVLPKGVSFRTAIRRSTRVKANAGVPLEDLGVQPDDIHLMTRRDILQSNADLIDKAGKFLSSPASPS